MIDFLIATVLNFLCVFIPTAMQTFFCAPISCVCWRHSSVFCVLGSMFLSKCTYASQDSLK